MAWARPFRIFDLPAYVRNRQRKSQRGMPIARVHARFDGVRDISMNDA
jgi:hypothetical protein